MEHDAIVRVIDLLITTGMTEYDAIRLVSRLLKQESLAAVKILENKQQAIVLN